MRKILGLDLGITSIGWSLIIENDNKKEILALGSRIIPLSIDDKDEFSSGNKISKNQKRTTKRTQRKGYDRYQLRRKALTKILLENDMFDDTLFKLESLELWMLRAKAAGALPKLHEKQGEARVTLKEFGRILYHLNQKRGYKSSRSDSNLDKKDTDYVTEVKNRHQEIKDHSISIGQKFYSELKQNKHYRIKQQVFPREAYIEEFEAICTQQQKHYPDIITNDFISKLKEEIIYYQRSLKSQKGLVSICELEKLKVHNKEGKELFGGPKVAPKSSPLFQVCKLWESINSITLKNKKGEVHSIPLDKKLELFNYLDVHEKLSSAKLFEILGLHKNDGWYSNKQIEKGIQGNIIKAQLFGKLKERIDLLTFNLKITEGNKEVYLVDKKTGEIIATNQSKVLDPDIEHQPLYQLWHTIYSISDIEECANALIKKFNLDKTNAQELASIDFTRYAFGNKSVKAMRKLLPYLMDGYVYSEACSFAGYNHSNSITNDENLQRELLAKIPNLSKGILRQPVVEKILNQMINLVNAVIEKHGKINEIRIELARELKQSKEERSETFSNLSKRERENETIRKRITEEFGLRSTRNNIIKWRLFHEINNIDSKTNATCIYCGKAFGITDSLTGNNVDVEHIIPKSLLFDDSQSNKTLSHRSCNEAKGNKTAYDFINSKGEIELNQYLERIDYLFKNRIIGKAKRDKLLMPESKIPKDFIDRQLRQTQYIAKKSKEILEQICSNVWSTSGAVTEYLRRVWGWDDVLMNLQLPKYRELNLTESREWETNDGQKHKQEVIKDWTKRDDHRHHAIDALVIACTQQGFIQRINNLSSKGNREEMYAAIGDIKRQGSLLETYLIAQRPFTTKEIENKASEILVSFKSGKKVATIGTRKIKKNGKKQVVQTDIIVPRGALSEESVYGKIKIIEKNKSLKYLFENPDLIFKDYIKEIVKERLNRYDNDAKKATASLKKEPVYLDNEKTKLLEYGTCYKEEYVIKYPLESIKVKDTEYIVDSKLKTIVKSRLEKYNNKEKEAFKEPLYLNENEKTPIRTVRVLTGLSSVEPVKKDANEKSIGFVKPGNNHHIAFYVDENGKKIEHGCTFWHAVERKKYELPVVIENPKETWNKILLNKDNYPENFLEKLPHDNWKFDQSLQQNEMFILGLPFELAKEAIEKNDKKVINQYLYRVQKMADSDYWFRLHTETQLQDGEGSKLSHRYYRFKSIGALEKTNPVKVRINNLGEILK